MTDRHWMPRCAIRRFMDTREKWHCCECGWPMLPCAETWPQFRPWTTASSPRLCEDVSRYLDLETTGTAP